ncbi:MAG: hypothetical protein HUU08_09515 [Candidatus Brocadia sp.]|nr:hypothetical protein [Candidatus Brocadia sp.]UJS17487.1 MAG: hypothetical protein L3J17_00100 [Candidatus Jettenia sp.]
MATKDNILSKEAKQGEKMIEVKLRFWTNDIASEPGKVIPKHAWAAGVVRMERNKSHGIEPSAPLPFHSLLDVGAAIEKVLIDHGVVLHSGRKMQKYFSNE